jgi:deoxyribose-phosphate aldolase
MGVDLSRMTEKDLAGVFDYSILPKNTTKDDILKGCALTREYQFAAFYSATAYWTPLVVQELKDYPQIEVGMGIAFPFGSQPAAVKAFETAHALKLGATAIDFSINVGALKSGLFKDVEEELKLYVDAAENAVTKVILETAFLTDEEITAACKMSVEVGVNMVKTSSGQFEGPTMEQFLVMKEAVKGSNVKLKVSGVKFPRPQNAFAFLLAGADRIGTRAAPEIIGGLETCRKIGLVPALKK